MTYSDEVTLGRDSQVELRPDPTSLRGLSSKNQTGNGPSNHDFREPLNSSETSAPLITKKRKPLSTTRLTEIPASSGTPLPPIPPRGPDPPPGAGATRIDTIPEDATQSGYASRENVDGLNDSTQSQLDHKMLSAPAGWPKEPLAPSAKNWSKISEIFVHILLALGASMFLLLATLSASVHNTFLWDTRRYAPGQPVVEILYYGVNGSIGDYITAPFLTFLDTPSTTLNVRLLDAAKFGPTIFPIIFSGILGGTLRLIARWRVEKGCKLETLEVLVGSRSLASTLTILFSLHSSSLMSFFLIILWGLSPLGGQASLRILSRTNITDATIDIPWTVPNVTDFQPTETLGSLGTRLDYLAAMATDSTEGGGFDFMAGPSDKDGHLLVPMVNQDTAWTVATWDTQNHENEAFSSMLGIPVYGPYTEETSVDLDGVIISSNLTFSISLFQFNCPASTDYLINDSWTDILSPQANKTDLRLRGESGSGFFLDTNSNFSAGESQVVLFGSFHQPKVTIWNCSVNLNIRDVSAACISSSQVMTGRVCGLLSMAPAQVSTLTPLSNSSYSSAFFNIWPIIDNAAINGSSATEHWILNGYIDLDDGLVDLSTVTSANFSSRLTAAFNTLWVSQLPFDLAWLTGQTSSLMNTTSATPMVFLPFTIVTCNWDYFTILTATSIFLIVCALFGAWLRYRIDTPDILGYVSSMTIENPYISIPGVEPGSASSLDGLQRTRLLKDLRVRIGDVQAGEEYGKIALATLDKF